MPEASDRVERSPLWRALLRDHDAVAVDRAEPELAHAPRLVAQGLDDLGAAARDAHVVLVDGVDDEVGEVGVVAELGRGQRVGALAEQDAAVVLREQAPAGGDVADLEWGLQLVAKRQVKPLLDRTLPLGEAANAHQLIAENRVRGNLVLLPWAA